MDSRSATILLTLLVSTLPAAADPSDCGGTLGYFDAAPASSGWFEGALIFRGDTTPVRLKLAGAGDGLRGWLDLPDLVYAWEPVDVSGDLEAFALALPFGVGRFEVTGGQTARTAFRDVGAERIELRLQPSGPPPFRCEPLVLDRGDGTRLAGLLVQPVGAGPHPAVVLAHGASHAGPQTWSYRSWADVYARQGVAVLLYGKRQAGDGSGNPRDVDLARLADDLEAAVEALNSQPGIDARRIGIHSFSQGGWPATRVAERSDAVAFLVLSSAPAMDPIAQERVHVEHEVRAADLGGPAVAEAIAYMRLYETTVRTGQGWPALRAAAARASEMPWGEYVDQPLEEWHLDWYRANAGEDPVPAWGRLRIPVLALYGAADRIVPPAVHAPLMRAAFAAGPGDLEVRVFDGADHRLEASMGRDGNGDWRWFHMADGVLDTLGDWLGRHVTHDDPRPGPE